MHDVTIIVPIYTTTKESLLWLDECLDSASIQDCHIIACNDGSPLSPLKVLDKYKHVEVISSEHRGVSSARNKAVAAATTELIIPLDCDDRLVPGAISKLLSYWDGEIPVYPDVCKFGTENVPHYNLLDFSCDNIYKHVGFSSVNVLHSREQWKSIGGWNEAIDFYEDGEYNARLFAAYCGKRYPEPLVEYRMHDMQRTKQYKSRSAAYAKKILIMIRSYAMACRSCGGKGNKNLPDIGNQPISVPNVVDVDSLPGEVDGRILAQYVGGRGRGKHYYRGISTKFPYKVTHGDYVYVDPADAISPDDPGGNSLFIKVVRETKQEVVTKAAKQVNRAARKNVNTKIPKVSATDRQELPDVGNMSVREIGNMDALPVEVAKRLLQVEKTGKNRRKVIDFLQSVVDNG